MKYIPVHSNYIENVKFAICNLQYEIIFEILIQNKFLNIITEVIVDILLRIFIIILYLL
jgi:hypothetical protein